MGRRELLAGLVSAPLLPWVLTSCLMGNDEPTVAYPVLAVPLDHAVVALLGLPPTGAVGALRELTTRVREVDDGKAKVMLALGASAFEVAGVAERRPTQLTQMPAFPGELLLPERSHSDVLLQVEAQTPKKVMAALDRLVNGLPGVTVRWQVAGRRPENRLVNGRSVTRNPFGFVDGLSNPSEQTRPSADDVTVIGEGSGEPAWAVGGSYLALRVIRLAQELWDADPVSTQERVIGRRRDGAWLDGTPSAGEPDFAADPDGAVTPLDSHVRRANPRPPGEPGPPLMRRSWAYSAGTASGGLPDEGVLFMCYQRDLRAGFESVQRRLEGQALDLYLLTVGGGYYLVPPPDHGDFRWEEALLSP